MLMGEYAHTIDAKGRVILPADFRAELGEHFFIVKGLDQCLYIYGENEWATFVQKVRQLPETKPETRRLVRHFFSSGRELECDRQWRFLVPGNLRSYACRCNLLHLTIVLGVVVEELIARHHLGSRQNDRLLSRLIDTL